MYKCRWTKKSIIILLLISTTGCLQNSSRKKTAPPGMVLIEAGEFIMGINNQTVLLDVMSDKLESKDATPKHEKFLDSYFIDRYETTYEQYSNYKPSLKKHIIGKETYPVSGINWFEADSFCKWTGKRLPTESEWEKAARGMDGRLYSWGNTFNPDFANLGSKLLKVGSKIKDISPYGVFDMGGNLSEWTSSWYTPYEKSTYKSSHYDKKYKVSRGGSFIKKSKGHDYREIFSQITYRHPSPPKTAAFDNGFRCIKWVN